MESTTELEYMVCRRSTQILVKKKNLPESVFVSSPAKRLVEYVLDESGETACCTFLMRQEDFVGFYRIDTPS